MTSRQKLRNSRKVGVYVTCGMPALLSITVACLLLPACADTRRNIGTVEFEFLEGGRVKVAAVRDGTTWFAVDGVRDTTWRSDEVGLDGTGFVYSIKYDLVWPGPGPCALVLDTHLPSRDALAHSPLVVGHFPGTPPFVEPHLSCPDVLNDLLIGIETLKAVRLFVIDGELQFDAKDWPTLVGRFSGRLALRSFSAY